MLNVFISSDNQSQNMPKLYIFIRIKTYRTVWTCGESNAGLARLFHTHCTFLVNVLMISQNIRFKPLQSRSKALSAASWLITPLISYNASERIKTWLKIYRNPHDTKILRGLYSAFLIHFAGFKLALAN